LAPVRGHAYQRDVATTTSQQPALAPSSFIDVETTDQSPRNAAPDRPEITHSICAERRPRAAPTASRLASGIVTNFFMTHPNVEKDSRAIARSVWIWSAGAKPETRNPTLYSGRNLHWPAASRQDLSLCSRNRLIKLSPAARPIPHQNSNDQIGENAIPRDARRVVSIQRP
jgi:hypothetical protein